MPAVNAAEHPVWQMQPSGTTASLRGIHSVDGQVAWASGTEGTVLRTLDGGGHWSRCATPDAEKDGATLDFRGVQAWDSETAIVMASGPGEKSRLYKTTDGCKSWKLVFKNLQRQGFWDSFQITGQKTGLLIGDPLPTSEISRFRIKTYFHFPLYGTVDGGESWNLLDKKLLFALSDEAGKPAQFVFAASNSSLLETFHHHWILFVVGGKKATLELLEIIDNPIPLFCKTTCSVSSRALLPLRTGPTSGGFSLSVRNGNSSGPIFVAVGGDYLQPELNEGSAATCSQNENGKPVTNFGCKAASTPPHGYRSAVQWSEILKLWITVGTNGSDLSRDDGKTWQPLDDGNWNALSLPFVVGPQGRIARLDPAALPATK